MDNFLGDRIPDREKTLAAMGAAMAGGCRTCADKLYEIALSIGIPETEMGEAFQTGLLAKSEAADTMREKASSLVGTPNESLDAGLNGKLSFFVRIASFTAANSAPDVIEEIRKAREHGITAEQVQICIGLGKMVRKNAISLSDGEISEQAGLADFGTAQSCCPASPESKSACSCV